LFIASKKPTIMIRFYIIFSLSLFYISFLSGQDLQYNSFHQNRMLFNPSLTGSHGSQSLRIQSKMQWWNDGGRGYRNLGIMYEESIPCSILDIGFKLLGSEEGEGIYRTTEAGFLSSVYLPINSTKQSVHNVKFGVDFSWGFNSIDFSRLIFSDQLDPKYGVVFPSSFSPPNEGLSSVYFNPGFGFSVKSLWNKNKKNPIASNFGLAMYRFYTINDGEINQSVSLLGLKTTNPYRMSGFAELEFVAYQKNRKFVSLRPLVLYQRQGSLHYIETGSRIHFTRSLGVGLYYHTCPGNEIGQTPWFTISTDVATFTSHGRKLQFVFSYSENMGGLQNLVGPHFELGIAYHLAKSTVCKWLKLEDEVKYSSGFKCPVMSISPGNFKLYENTWYD
jgi:type IX secretion system PorP/SprF family membrane protein